MTSLTRNRYLTPAVYVLHSFQKKSPSGIRTDKRDQALVHERLKRAPRQTGVRRVSEDVTISTGNVFRDLGRPDAAERQTKTRLAMAINDIIAGRKLRQVDAAAILGIP